MSGVRYVRYWYVAITTMALHTHAQEWLTLAHVQGLEKLHDSAPQTKEPTTYHPRLIQGDDQ